MGIPSEMDWTPAPPSQEAIDTGRWKALVGPLIQDGVLTATEQDLLTQPFVATPSKHGWETTWAPHTLPRLLP